MKKFTTFVLTAAMVFSLAACGNSNNAVNSSIDTKLEESAASTDAKVQEEADKPETITITAHIATGEEAEVTVPYDPQRIAILDFAALDILDNLGLGDRVVGCASTTLDYLKKYTENDDVKLLGTIKEADLEAVMSCEPDIIFIGGRLSASYDALSEIAPVVYLATDSEVGVVESTRRNAAVIASIFGREDEMAEKFAGFDERIKALQALAEGKTAVVGMCTSGSFNVIGNGGRCSIIGVEVGFENLNDGTDESSERSGGRGEGSGNGGSGEGSGRGGDSQGSGRGGNGGSGNGESGQGANNSAHGSEASFELIVSQNPDYIFVMDRDAAIGTDGAQLAAEIMDNELIGSTDAYKNGNLVILENPAVWYTAEGGVTALDIMISDLESALIQ